MGSNDHAEQGGTVCDICDQAILRNHEGTWIHIDAAGKQLRGVGHGAKGPCRTPEKRTYPTRKAAAIELESLRQGGVFADGRPYRCAPCKGWHITSAPTTRTGKRGAAHGSLVHDPVLREHLNRLGNESRNTQTQ